MERFQNWQSYSFDDQEPYAPKPNREAIIKFHFKKGYQLKTLNHYEALFYNAEMMRETYNGPFDVLLSGGIDSEVAVRTFHHLGIKQNVYTFKINNDLNKRDLDSAIHICDELGIKLNIIDFDLKKWVENEAEAIYKKTLMPSVEKLVRFSYYNYLDNIIVLGEGEPYWRRTLGADYSQKSDWKFQLAEYDFMNSMYGKLTGRTVIGEWYMYTPEVIMSFHKLPIIQRLLNDEFPGKVSSWSSRTEIYRKIWPTIQDKPKLVGYEHFNHPFHMPEYLEEFRNTVIKGTSNQYYWYSLEELENLLKE